MMRVLLVLAAWLLAYTGSLAANDLAKLTESDVGKISFLSSGSIEKRNERVLELRDKSLTLTGELRFPDGAGPFPVVVLMHGCAGLGYAEVTWAPRLRQWGYATFIVDSLGPRRIPSLCDNVARLFPVQRVPDAYGALRLLATHPKIAADRIALMGFSHGGIVTLSAATAWAQRTFAPGDQARFRAFIPFYPYCNAIVPEYEEISAPLRVHAGALDDWTPAKPCAALTERLRAKGFDAEISTYDNAHHAFDDPFGTVIKLPNVSNVATCTPQFESILGPATATDPWAGCIKRGATVGRNPKAIEAAQETLQKQLAQLFASKSQ